MCAKKAATRKVEAGDSFAMQDVSFLPGTTRDQPVPDDTLGFEPYVTAIARFLTNSATQPPLTISIEGEWGSGKSSFMVQLQERLKDEGQAIVNFNAWRHDSEEALWAAFAIQFWEQTTAGLHWWKRQYVRLKLFGRRFEWWRAFWRVLRDTLILSALLTAATFVLFRLTSVMDMDKLPDHLKWLEGFSDLSKAFKKLGSGVLLSLLLSAVPFLWRVVVDSSRSFSSYVSQFVDSPRYEDRVSFVERFHVDFKKMVKSVAKGGDTKDGGTVYVFIDDLDRCQVPRAAELMQALNLMISNDPRIVFIIGMDREKIAAGFAVKHKELLPYLSVLEPSGDDTPAEGFGIEYGYTFIEKFIQLPFVVPQPGQRELETYLTELASPQDKAKSQSIRAWIVETARTLWGFRKWARIVKIPKTLYDKCFTKRSDGQAKDTDDKGGHQEKTPEQERRLESMRLTAEGDSPKIRAIVQAIAPTLNFNPRRLKQFVNLFRLRLLIAVETGLFDTPRGERKLTLEQLSKFVVIQLKWPLLLADLERFPELWEQLHLKAFDQLVANLGKLGSKFAPNVGKSPTMPNSLEHWLERRDLLSFLKVGSGGDSLEAAINTRWFLNAADIQKLQGVFPRVRTVDLTPTNATVEPMTVDVSGVIASNSHLKGDPSVEETASAGDSFEGKVDRETQVVPSFLPGEWLLKFEWKGVFREEVATIDESGNYYTKGGEEFQLKDVHFDESKRLVRFLKDMGPGKRRQIEVLEVSPDNNRMEGYARHDKHRLIYDRVKKEG